MKPTPDLTNQADIGLCQIESRAAVLSEAYRSRLSWLWWVNLLFVVVPAVLSAAAIIAGGLKPPLTVPFLSDMSVASACIGLAAILIAVHKVMKCDEHQAECLRLCQSFASIALAARNALSAPETKRPDEHERLGTKLESLVESSKARIPRGLIEKLKTESA